MISLDLQVSAALPAAVQQVCVDLTASPPPAAVAGDLVGRHLVTTVIQHAGAVRERPLEQVAPRTSRP